MVSVGVTAYIADSKLPCCEQPQHFVSCRSDKNSPRPRPPPMKQKSNYTKTWEDEFLENYKPPSVLTNRYVWVASIVVGAGLAVYSATLR